MSRPSTQHRLSVGSSPSSLPVRSPVPRSHSHAHAHALSHIHSVSLGSANPGNRINRRKSSTFGQPAHPVAIAAVADASGASRRRSSVSKAALASLHDAASHLPLPSSSLPYHASISEFANGGSAIVDGPSLSTFHGKPSATRRASDGTRLLTKKERAAAGDLKCEHCGKAYKHGSCLNKHLWEHTPQWQYTSKLLISKHQQVQLLEAASVLVQMNTDGPAVGTDSDNSPSPAASEPSDRDDEAYSSTETTPPPHADSSSSSSAFRHHKRDSNMSGSAYSRSYQSALSDANPLTDGGFAHFRQWSSSSASRPVTAATSIAESYKDEDPQDLAAAVGLLSCSYGTPKTAPIGLSSDVPPVPPLPAKYANISSSHFANQDVMMEDDEEDMDEHDVFSGRATSQYHHNHQQTSYSRHQPSHSTSQPQQHHDEDEYMFGKMDA